MGIENLIGKGIRGAIGLVTGGLSERLFEIVQGALPQNTPPEVRAQIQMTLEREITAREKIAADAAFQAEQALTARIAELEGTAADLRGIPVLGPVMLFLRGSQRPVWGFATLYVDFMVFSHEWPLPPESSIEGAFWAMNVLVLGFLFGERAVKNVLPFVRDVVQARGQGDRPVT